MVSLIITLLQLGVNHVIVWGYTSAQQITTPEQSWWTTKEMVIILVTNLGKNNLGKVCTVYLHIFGIHKISDNNF